MRVVVDANIVFSAILNAKGKIGDILINHSHKCDFIAPDFLRIEISKYHGKLSKISGLTIRDILESEYQIFKNIKFISEEQILQTSWNKAVELVKDIDEKDIVYVALAIEFGCFLWSGDKKLMSGLTKKLFNSLYSTDNLYNIVIKNN